MVQRRMNRCGGLAALLCAAVAGGAQAAPVLFDFESLADGEALTTQYAGMSFSHAMALTAGVSLNEIDFPPRSGSNVVFDAGGFMVIEFATPVRSVAGYFTYAQNLFFAVFDTAHQPLASLYSGAPLNLGSFGGAAPNELLGYTAAGALISRVAITGDPGGSSFVLDDLVVDFVATPVPEPGTALLVGTLLGVGVLPGGWLRRGGVGVRRPSTRMPEQPR